MQQPVSRPQAAQQSGERASDFYRQILLTLNAAGIPVLIGGAYAFNCYTGISRFTKDLDIFIKRSDFDRLSDAMAASGFHAELTYPHWLAKIYDGDDFVDVIFNSGNGIAEVDDVWFQYATDADVLGAPAKICPVEETIWSKAFIMERERYDGADIAHLIRACGQTMDWRRLLWRFDPNWRVLLSHLVLFGFVYPAHRDLVPVWLMDELMQRLRAETHSAPPSDTVCSGPLLSREQYLTDIEQWGYRDARVAPLGNMSPQDAATWTAAINRDQDKKH